ncbi:hypothetical protein [Streptomyces chilikensis]|uniref:hypothetical protein n=1 Tax=Streptomyces chilikensis TaxID=1194079 RepID=UPI001408FD0B|nr:hypothetical protein [Streptomyces chilikensis]
MAKRKPHDRPLPCRVFAGVCRWCGSGLLREAHVVGVLVDGDGNARCPDSWWPGGGHDPARFPGSRRPRFS